MMRGAAAFMVALALAGPAGAQMPDLAQMSGVPLPTGDLPVGTVSVRVVRGDLSNVVANQPVELHVGPSVVTSTTDAEGRAQFPGVAAGASVHAFTTIDGQRLESREFTMPDQAGVRLVLVAGAAAGSPAPAPGAAPAAPAAPAVAATPGTVVFAGQSRVIVELADDALDVYFLLDVVNPSGAPVSVEPLVFEAPPGARGTTVLENSSPQAKADGSRVVIEGPFAPGTTTVQFAYQLPVSDSRLQFSQRFPAALTPTSLIVQKWGQMHFVSPQAGDHQEIVNKGQAYVVGRGPGLRAGERIDVDISGLPHHPSWPRHLSLALAAFVIGAGVWLSLGDGQPETEGRRQALEKRREQLLGELVKVEEQRLAGRMDDVRYQARREGLVGQLELVYSQLEQPGAAPGA
jgi:hypothetical protein